MRKNPMQKRLYSGNEMEELLQAHRIMHRRVEGEHAVEVLPAQTELARTVLCIDYATKHSDSHCFNQPRIARRFAESFSLLKGQGLDDTDIIYFDMVG
jgi:hypothetical protein